MKCGTIEVSLVAEIEAGEVPPEQVCRTCKKCPDITVGPYALRIAELAGLPEWRLTRMFDAGEIGDDELRLIEVMRHGSE